MPIATINNCFKIGTGDNERYFGQINTNLIKDITQVFYFEYEPKNYCKQVGEIEDKKGYQRRAKPKRQRDFGTYTEAFGQDLVSPPLLLNGRGQWRFEPDAPNSNYGKIIVEEPANIIDGKHRAGGFIYAYEELSNAQTTEFIVYKNMSLDREERIFNIINTTQKGVPPSLSVNIEKEKWENRVTVMLAETSTSPFVNVISLSGTMNPNTKFQAAQVAKNVKRTFADDVFRIAVLSDEQKFDYFCEAWELVKDSHLESWEVDIPRKEMKFKLFELTGLIAWSIVFHKRLGTYYNTTTKHIDFNGLKIAIDKTINEIDFLKDGEYEGLTGEVGGARISSDILNLMQR